MLILNVLALLYLVGLVHDKVALHLSSRVGATIASCSSRLRILLFLPCAIHSQMAHISRLLLLQTILVCWSANIVWQFGTRSHETERRCFGATSLLHGLLRLAELIIILRRPIGRLQLTIIILAIIGHRLFLLELLQLMAASEGIHCRFNGWKVVIISFNCLILNIAVIALLFLYLVLCELCKSTQIIHVILRTNRHFSCWLMWLRQTNLIVQFIMSK